MEDMDERSYRNMIIEEIFGTSEEEEEDNDDRLSPQNFENEVLDENDSTRDVQEGPKTGDIFSSVDSLLNFYQEHARLKGFAVVKRAAHKGKHEEYKYITLSCDRGRNVHFEKHSKRINCPVRINAIKRDLGFWEVSKVLSMHNHDLDPEMSCLMPAHRNLSVHLKRQLEANDIAGVRPCKNIRMHKYKLEDHKI